MKFKILLNISNGTFKDFYRYRMNKPSVYGNERGIANKSSVKPLLFE